MSFARIDGATRIKRLTIAYGNCVHISNGNGTDLGVANEETGTLIGIAEGLTWT